MYQVIDNQTGAVIGKSATFARACSLRDRKDAEYGACRYSVKFVGVPA